MQASYRAHLVSATAMILFCAAGCEQKDGMRFGGYVESEKIEVGSRVGGRVAQVFVEEGDSVEQGSLLVQFETAHLEAQVEEAEQRAKRLEAVLEKLVAGPRPQEIAVARSSPSTGRRGSSRRWAPRRASA